MSLRRPLQRAAAALLAAPADSVETAVAAFDSACETALDSPAWMCVSGDRSSEAGKLSTLLWGGLTPALCVALLSSRATPCVLLGLELLVLQDTPDALLERLAEAGALDAILTVVCDYDARLRASTPPSLMQPTSGMQHPSALVTPDFVLEEAFRALSRALQRPLVSFELARCDHVGDALRALCNRFAAPAPASAHPSAASLDEAACGAVQSLTSSANGAKRQTRHWFLSQALSWLRVARKMVLTLNASNTPGCSALRRAKPAAEALLRGVSGRLRAAAAAAASSSPARPSTSFAHALDAAVPAAAVVCNFVLAAGTSLSQTLSRDEPSASASSSAAHLFDSLLSTDAPSSLRALLLSPSRTFPKASSAANGRGYDAAASTLVVFDAVSRMAGASHAAALRLCTLPPSSSFDAATARSLLATLLAVGRSHPDKNVAKIGMEASCALAHSLLAGGEALGGWLSSQAAQALPPSTTRREMRVGIGQDAHAAADEVARALGWKVSQNAGSRPRGGIVEVHLNAAASEGGPAPHSHGGATASVARAPGATPAGRCDGCGTLRMESDARLLTCGRCKRAFYCDKECQKKAWGEHKKACEPPPARS